MIDINELRRLAQDQEWIGRWYDAGCETLMAERDGEHEEVAHPMPIGLVPYLVAVQPAAITELLDRLEAAESEAIEQARLNGMGAERELALIAKLEMAEKERDKLRAEAIYWKEQKEPGAAGWRAIARKLRAKIEQMERQEPVVYQHKVPCVNLQGELLGYTDWKDGKGLDDWPHRTLYALPVAQPELNLSDPAAQKRLATQWGYVQKPHPDCDSGCMFQCTQPSPSVPNLDMDALERQNDELKEEVGKLRDALVLIADQYEPKCDLLIPSIARSALCATGAYGQKESPESWPTEAMVTAFAELFNVRDQKNTFGPAFRAALAAAPEAKP